MSREFFDFVPDTGIVHYIEEDGDDVIVRTEQDVEPVMERAKKLANDGRGDRGIKEGWWHIADVPPTIWLEIKQKYNCDMFTADDNEWKRFLQILKRDYGHFLTTHKRIV